MIAATPVLADVSGMVVDDADNPVAGAVIHLQADPDGPTAVSAADGSYTLAIAMPGPVVIGAAVEYYPDAPVNYNTTAVSTTNPNAAFEIELLRLPTTEDPNYDPPAVGTSCAPCHAEIFFEWEDSVHSTAAVDFWVRDLFSGDGSPGGGAGFVFRDTHDPGDTGTCATCHAPMADAFDPGNTFLDEVNANGDQAELDGVSCLACHQMHRFDGDVNAIHILGQSEYRFPDGDLDAHRFVWGPLDDTDLTFMRASYEPAFDTARICASCHQYSAPFGQTTYEEWLASPYSIPGEGFRNCQDCHMETRDSDGTVCEVGGPVRPASQRHQHSFIGSTPETLSNNVLLEAAIVDQTDGVLTVEAAVTNAGAGHSFPTGVSIRNAMLVITAEAAGEPLIQVAGPTVPDWANDDVPGVQEGDYGGLPGTGYAKILEGRINGMGDPVTPVLFVDAETVLEYSSIPSAGTDLTQVQLRVPDGVSDGTPITIDVRLLYRRSFRALAVTKGWTETPQGGPIEIEVASQVLTATATGGPTPVEIPAAGTPALLILMLLIAAVAVRRLR